MTAITPMRPSQSIKTQTMRFLVDVYLSLMHEKDLALRKYDSIPENDNDIKTLVLQCTHKAKIMAALESAIDIGTTFLLNRDLMLLDSQFYQETVKIDIHALLDDCAINLHSKLRQQGLDETPDVVKKTSRLLQIELLLDRKKQVDNSCSKMVGIVNISDSTINREHLETFKEELLSEGMPLEQFNNLTADDTSYVYLAYMDVSRVISKCVMDLGREELDNFLKRTRPDRLEAAKAAINECKLSLLETSNYDRIHKAEAHANN